MQTGAISRAMLHQQVQLTVLRKALDMATSNARGVLSIVETAADGEGQQVDTKV